VFRLDRARGSPRSLLHAEGGGDVRHAPARARRRHRRVALDHRALPDHGGRGGVLRGVLARRPGPDPERLAGRRHHLETLLSVATLLLGASAVFLYDVAFARAWNEEGGAVLPAGPARPAGAGSVQPDMR
jgi:hypothetical protein